MKQVIRFTASWCSPCKVYAPTFERVANEVSGVNFETIDVDSGNPLIIELGIRNVPTTVILEDGQVIKKRSGNIGAEQLKQFIG